MGRISSGTGLVSGLDIQSLVKQLMDIESKPLRLVQQQITNTQKTQTAYTTLSAQLTALKGAITALTRPTAFSVRTATSSNNAVLTATAGSSTPTGNYSFTVRSLVTAHQLVSRGYRDRDTTPMGAGTITLEGAGASVAPSTPLNSLNDGAGIRRGVIRIVDRRGVTADVDLTAATTVDDILQAINAQGQVAVRADISGGRIVLTDTSGGTTTAFRVADVGLGRAAADLGLDQTVSGDQIIGRDLVAISPSTRLSRLNDGLGIRFNNRMADFQVNLADGSRLTVNLTDILTFDTPLGQLNDGRGVRLGTIRITNRLGQTADVDLSAARTLADVKNAIQNADIGVQLTAITGNRVVLRDTSGGTTHNFRIEDVTGYAAADLGIAGQAEANGDSISGSQVFRLDTLNAVIAAVAYARDDDGQLNQGRLTLDIDDKRLVLIDHTTGTAAREVIVLNGSRAVADLGLNAAFGPDGRLRTRPLAAGLNTVLLSTLKGGAGLAVGDLSFTLRNGSTLDGLDFSAAATLNDLIEIINRDGRVTARVDTGGMRLLITDNTTGSGTFSATGTLASSLGLTFSAPGVLSSADLQRQYISENTRLTDLNAGQGVRYGRIAITAADGNRRELNITAALHRTIGEVIDEINRMDMGVTARINADGDGIELVDTTGGPGRLRVEEVGTGRAAADLGILGTADESGVLTGSFARRIRISATDRLDQVVTRINQAGGPVVASIIHDGSTENPYRLVLSARQGGTAGRISFTVDGLALSLSTLTEPGDARVIVGQPGTPSAVVVTSGSNTIADIVPGLRLNLVAASETPVQVTVTQDIDAVVNNVKSFIDSFNRVMNSIADLTRFDPDTRARGQLAGDSAAQQIVSRLTRLIESSIPVDGSSINRLRDIGIMIDSLGGRGLRLTLSRTLGAGAAGAMTVDGEAQLRAALAENPEAVSRLFTHATTDELGRTTRQGIALRLQDELDALAGSGASLLSARNATLNSRVEQYNRRVEFLQDMLNRKEARLFAQFRTMENALAGLQSQQSALNSLAYLASSLSTNNVIGGLSARR